MYVLRFLESGARRCNFRIFDNVLLVAGPAAVFHPTIRNTSGVVTGFMILEPSMIEHRRALDHLHREMNYSTSRFDGGDEEFWSSFYPLWNEIPVAFHARFRMGYPRNLWNETRLFHAISNFMGDSAQLPRHLRTTLRYF